jgi:hypothetical protein
MVGKFFHTPKPRGFYIPYRYYSPEKEEREEREKRIKKELGIDEERDPDRPYVANIRGKFSRLNDEKHRWSEAQQRKSNARLIGLILVFVLILYLFFYSNLFK